MLTPQRCPVPRVRGLAASRGLHTPLSLLVLAALLVLGTAGCVDRNSPEYAVHQMVDALRAHDRLRLEAFLDQDQLAESLVDEANQRALAKAQQTPGYATNDLYMGMSLGRRAQVEMMRSEIREALSELPNPQRRRSTSEETALDSVRIGNVYRRENLAEVEIVVPGPDAKSPARLMAKLERSGGRWRLIGLNNTSALEKAVAATAEPINQQPRQDHRSR